MLEIQKKFRLKRRIIELLDNNNKFLSVRQISDLLPNESFTAINLACSELREEFEYLYKPDEIEFIVNPRKGIKLIRKGHNIQKLIEYMITESLSYKIICSVFSERQVNVLDFCQTNFISKSTLARQLKTINETLHNHGMHIAFSNRMTLKGEEGTIRLFLQLFLFSIHSTINSIDWIHETDEHVELTKQILYYLNIPAIENQIQHLAVFVFVISNGIQQNENISTEDVTLKYAEFYEFQPKPFFLESWTDTDWQFFLLYVYSSNISSLAFALKKVAARPFKNETTLWIEKFEEVFGSLSKQQKTELFDMLERQLQFDSMIFFDNFLLEIFEIIRLENLVEDFPDYLEYFERFWKSITESCDKFANSEYLQTMSFLNSMYLVKLIAFNPVVRIFVYSDISHLHKNFIEDRINYHLSKYNVDFVTTSKNADIIVSTGNFLNQLTKQQQIVEIRSSLPNIDLLSVERAVEFVFDGE